MIFFPLVPISLSEPEILDVFLELMLAAQEILCGGAGNRTQGPKAAMAMGAPTLTTVVKKGSLMNMATKGIYDQILINMNIDCFCLQVFLCTIENTNCDVHMLYFYFCNDIDANICITHHDQTLTK